MSPAAEGSPASSGTLHILHLDAGRTLRGGQKQVLLLLRGLRERGHRVTLGCPPGPLRDAARARGIPLLPLPLRGEWDLSSAWKIKRFANSHAADIIHTHDAHSHGLARLSQVLGLQRPLIVHRRVDFPLSPGVWNRWKYLDGVSAFAVVTQGIGKRLERLGVPPSKIAWIPSSVDLPTLDQEQGLAFPEGVLEPPAGELLITCVGALEEEKGQHLLLSSAVKLLKDFPTLRLYFLGEGRDRQKLESIARALGVEQHCLFAGFVQPVAPIVKRSTCVVLPTLSEGFSPAALEAMALGTPVIASATGGLMELITPGEDGLLFPPGDSEQLQAAIRRVLSEPKLREELGRQAEKKVRANYTSERMLERTLALYRRGLEQRRSLSI